MPKWSNVFDLPGPLVDVIKHDLYSEKRGEQLAAYRAKHGLPPETPHLSVSDLIKPPRMRLLISRHFDEIVKDVSGDVFRLLGQLFHHLFRDSAMRKKNSGYVAEQRLFTHIQVDGQVVIISGEPDLVSAEGVLDDYKVTGIYGWDKGVKIEWEQQLNCYAWLRHMNQLDTIKLRAVYILRDWKQSEAMQEGYPPAAAMTMDVTMWPIGVTETYVLDRARAHQDARGEADDRLPECTPAEMWERPEAWAVQREGAKRAAKVYRADAFPPGTPSETLRVAANADTVLRNGKLKKGELPFNLEHRPGERVRCQSFCDARFSCNIYKEWASATFRGRAATEEAV
jgi:hypothetical protein